MSVHGGRRLAAALGRCPALVRQRTLSFPNTVDGPPREVETPHGIPDRISSISRGMAWTDTVFTSDGQLSGPHLLAWKAGLLKSRLSARLANQVMEVVKSDYRQANDSPHSPFIVHHAH